MTEHEFSNGRCLHCGADSKHDGSGSTCIPRAGEAAPRPKPASGVDDAKTISTRIAELQAERQNAINRPSDEATGG